MKDCPQYQRFDVNHYVSLDRILKREDRAYFSFLRKTLETNIEILKDTLKNCVLLHSGAAKRTIQELREGLSIAVRMEREAERYLVSGRKLKKKVNSVSKLSFSSNLQERGMKRRLDQSQHGLMRSPLRGSLKASAVCTSSAPSTQERAPIN